MTEISWFKHFHGAASDPKWLAIADAAGSSPAVVWHTFSWALEYASEREDRGSILGLDPDVIASFCRVAVDEITKIIDAMVRKGIIVDGYIRAWGKRQGAAAQVSRVERSGEIVSAAAERTRRWRRKKAVAGRQLDLPGVAPADVTVASHPPVTTVTVASHPPVTVTTEKERDSDSNYLLNENESDGSLGRDAPLEKPPVTNVVPIADSATLKARKKEARRQKVFRFIMASYAGEELSRRMNGMMGLDPARDEQWWFDKCDAERQLRKWDDTTDRPERARRGGWQRLA